MSAAVVLIAALSVAGADRYAQAKSFFEAGQQAFEANEFDAAALAYQQALDLLPAPKDGRNDPRPAIVFSLAQAYRRHYFDELDTEKRSLDSLDRAVEAYRRYLVMTPDGSRRTDAKDHLATLELELARVSLMGLRRKAADAERPTRIMITSKTAGAQASIDGTKTATVPVVRDVEPGKHKITVSREGYFTEELETEAVKGSLAVVPVDLRAKPAKLRIEAPSDAMRTVPQALWCDVEVGVGTEKVLLDTIDGRMVGVAPIRAALELEAGRRLVTVTAAGRQSYSRELDLSRGVQESLRVDLEPTGQRQAARYFLIGGGVVAAVGVLTGVTALLNNAAARVYFLRLDTGNEVLTQADLVNYRAARSDYVKFSAISVTTLIVAAVVLATGGVLYAFDSPSSATGPQVEVAPLNLPNDGGSSPF